MAFSIPPFEWCGSSRNTKSPGEKNTEASTGFFSVESKTLNFPFRLVRKLYEVGTHRASYHQPIHSETPTQTTRATQRTCATQPERHVRLNQLMGHTRTINNTTHKNARIPVETRLYNIKKQIPTSLRTLFCTPKGSVETSGRQLEPTTFDDKSSMKLFVLL